MSDLVFIYSTFPDRQSALKVAGHLVEAKLAACANLSAPITSVYRWEGKIETAEEIAAIFKTRREMAEAAIAAARALHPYEVPCFVILPVEGGWGSYLDWVRAETSGPA